MPDAANEYGAIRHSDWKWAMAEINRLKRELSKAQDDAAFYKKLSEKLPEIFALATERRG